jgi:hypothetical protein
MSAREVQFVRAQLALLRHLHILVPHDHLLELAVPSNRKDLPVHAAVLEPHALERSMPRRRGPWPLRGLGRGFPWRLSPWRCRGGQHSCCSSPRCSSPATPPCAEKKTGRCIRCFLVPLHQEPGSERISSRIRGAHLASDGPQLQGPRGLSAIRRPAVRAQRVCERRLQSSTAKICHFESKSSRACYRDSLHQISTRPTNTPKEKTLLLWCND